MSLVAQRLAFLIRQPLRGGVDVNYPVQRQAVHGLERVPTKPRTDHGPHLQVPGPVENGLGPRYTFFTV